MPPRKTRLDPLERILRAGARMIPGTLAGRAESAAPVRRAPLSPNAVVPVPASGGHSHDGVPANTTIVGGVAEAGTSAPIVAGPQSVVIGDYAESNGVSSSFGGNVVIGGGDSASAGHHPETGPDGIGLVLIGGWGSGTGAEAAPYAGGYQDVVIGQACETIDEADGGDNNVVIGSASFSAGFGNIVIGYSAFADDGTPGNVNDAVVIGENADVASGSGVALGENSQVTEDSLGGVALGPGAAVGASVTYPSGMGAIAIGLANGTETNTGAIGKGTISIGGRGRSQASGGKAARANGDGAVAIGGDDGTYEGAKAIHVDSIALGCRSETSATDQVAIDTRHIEMQILAGDPATPAAGHVRVYAKDNGGTARLYYKDDGGTVRGPL